MSAVARFHPQIAPPFKSEKKENSCWYVERRKNDKDSAFQDGHVWKLKCHIAEHITVDSI